MATSTNTPDGGNNSLWGATFTSTRASFAKGEDTVLLSAEDEPCDLVDVGLGFNTSSLRVYAETVLLRDNIDISGHATNAPAKSLSVQCHVLAASTPGGSGDVVIDVSGGDGVNGREKFEESNPKTQPARAPAGGLGMPAGTLSLYVETPSSLEAIRKVRFVAKGGRGGSGSAAAVASGVMGGGDGGEGGAGGSIRIIFSSIAGQIVATTRGLNNLNWASIAQKWISTITPLFPGVEVLNRGPYDAAPAIYTAVRAYDTLRLNLEALASQLTVIESMVVYAGGEVAEDVSTAADNLKERIQSYFEDTVVAPETVTSVIATSAAVSSLTRTVTTWNGNSAVGNNSDKDTAALLEGLKGLALPTGEKSKSELSVAVKAMYSEVYLLWEKIRSDLKKQCDVSGGAGGNGGMSGNANSNPGAPGKAGASGVVSVIDVVELGASLTNYSSFFPIAFPEQCQMLLDKANMYYTSGTVPDQRAAAAYYQRLGDRLELFQGYQEPAEDVPTGSLTPATTKQAAIYAAYRSIEALSIDPVDQLQDIYNTAHGRLGRIIQRQDMFGHSTGWVPRLSVRFYQTKAARLLQTLAQAEADVAECEATFKTVSDARTAIDHAASSLINMRNEAILTRTLLEDPEKGPITTAAFQIANYTPELKEKKYIFKQRLALVKADIQNFDNIDPQVLIDGFAMFAFGPSPLNAAGQGLAAGYKTYAQLKMVPDESGNLIEDDYIVTQFAACDDTLASVAEAVRQRSDGSLDSDDPGAMKIMAASDDIKKLLDTYKKGIHGEDADALHKSLDDLMATVELRNKAVIEYNCALQLLQETRQTIQTLQARSQSLGQQALSLDPNLLSALTWLRNAKQDMVLSIMQMLNYQDRAIQYWGLQAPLDFAAAPNMLASEALAQRQRALENWFDGVLEDRGAAEWTVWPSEGERVAAGVNYYLSAAELAALKTRVVNRSDGSVAYSVKVTVSPRSDGPFGSRTCVGLSRVRLWLPGATVEAEDGRGRRPISARILHSGSETILDERGRKWDFTHVPVQLEFTYDSAGVIAEGDCTSDRRMGETALDADVGLGQNEVSKASLGPFTTWVLELKVSKTENVGLDLRNVKTAFLEFWGRSRPLRSL